VWRGFVSFVVFVVNFDGFAALYLFGLQVKGLDLKMNNVIIKKMKTKDNVNALVTCFKEKKHNLLQISGDDFDIEETLTSIREDFDPKDIETFFPDDAPEAIKSLRMKTLFGGKLMIFYDVDTLSASLFKEIKDSVKNPDRLSPNFAVLIFRDQKKMFKIEDSLMGKFKPIYNSDIPAWIRNFAGKIGYRVSEEATNLLCFRCGINRGEIKKHIERIISLKDDQDKSIEEEDLKNIGFYRDDTIFEISNSILDGNYNDALRYLVEYSDNVPVFHFINRDIRCLLTVRASIDEGENTNESDLSRRLNMHPYIFKKKYLPAARRLSYEVLEKNFERIMDTEYQIKNGWEELSMNFNFVSQLQ
jgi:DNA polymerase III delta subunit